MAPFFRGVGRSMWAGKRKKIDAQRPMSEVFWSFVPMEVAASVLMAGDLRLVRPIRPPSGMSRMNGHRGLSHISHVALLSRLLLAREGPTF